MTGDAGVGGVLTVVGDVLTNTVANATTAGLVVSSGTTLDVSGGLTRVLSTNGNLVLKAVSPITNAFLLGGQAFVQNLDGGGMSVNQGEGVYGYNASFNEKVRMEHGLALVPGMGTYAAPAAATLQAPGAYTFSMTGNKAFVTTGSGAFTLIVTLPLDGLGNTNNWVAIYSQINNTPTNVSTFVQNGGTSLLFQNAGITTPITVGITLL
jgi:hypothetical protein